MRKVLRIQYGERKTIEDTIYMHKLKVGAVVGSDFYGPCMNVASVSGFGMSIFVQHSKRKGSATTSLKQTKGDIP